MFISNKLRVTLWSLIIGGIVSLILISVGIPDSDMHTLASKRQQPTPLPGSNSKKENRHRPGIEEIKSLFPKVDYDAPEPSDPAEKTKRRNKSKHFDKLGGVSKEPTHYSSGLVSEWDLDLPALPVTESSVVLIGRTLTRGAFLSNDRGAVYTELSVKVEDVLKSNSDSVTKGSVIDISRLGGVVRYRTGEESLFLIVGQNMPTVAKRYLFFLKAIKDSPDFQIITGYEIGASGVQALDTPGQFSHYNGTDEATFLNTLRSVIAEQKQ